MVVYRPPQKMFPLPEISELPETHIPLPSGQLTAGENCRGAALNDESGIEGIDHLAIADIDDGMCPALDAHVAGIRHSIPPELAARYRRGPEAFHQEADGAVQERGILDHGIIARALNVRALVGTFFEATGFDPNWIGTEREHAGFAPRELTILDLELAGDHEDADLQVPDPHPLDPQMFMILHARDPIGAKVREVRRLGSDDHGFRIVADERQVGLAGVRIDQDAVRPALQAHRGELRVLAGSDADGISR